MQLSETDGCREEENKRVEEFRKGGQEPQDTKRKRSRGTLGGYSAHATERESERQKRVEDAAIANS